ncbi:hypothetical protein FA15DRAFT_710695 [Coprinopsis marcescibilis]|uniref:Uncharacterized protein n=1 Tax=Coprinopsis marcescibilis TaxID=230819 RepID=A0A5C3KCG7_COPMA|nr:hypothetical protein FA15DRAFT_710695 [Coprinopsis marcescibilis]
MARRLTLTFAVSQLLYFAQLARSLKPFRLLFPVLRSVGALAQTLALLRLLLSFAPLARSLKGLDIPSSSHCLTL